MKYELARMSHFINKLELLINNCPTSQRSTAADTLRVSVPHSQTLDAIEQLKMHLQELLKDISH
jgi:hypothetical protein